MVVLKNITEKIVISHEAKIATSFFDRLFGLLNSHNPRFLIFHTHFGLHTLFMDCPLDIILLNKKSRVVKIQENLMPFRFFLYSPKYSTVIEMPQGTIKKCRISLNDKILIA